MRFDIKIEPTRKVTARELKTTAQNALLFLWAIYKCLFVGSNLPSISSYWMVYKNYCSSVSKSLICVFLNASKKIILKTRRDCTRDFYRKIGLFFRKFLFGWNRFCLFLKLYNKRKISSSSEKNIFMKQTNSLKNHPNLSVEISIEISVEISLAISSSF